MPKRRYAQAEEGHSLYVNGISIGWPRGGEREVVEFDESELPGLVRNRLAADPPTIVEVDLPVTKQFVSNSPYKVLTGDEAKALRAEPPAEVTVLRYDRSLGRAQRVAFKTGEIVDTAPPAAAQLPATGRSVSLESEPPTQRPAEPEADDIPVPPRRRAPAPPAAKEN